MFPQPLSHMVGKIAGKALSRKAAALGTLLGSWEIVAGKDFAAVSVPVKLARSPQGQDQPAILHLAVPPAWKTEFQHEGPLLIARINAFFGYKAVGELRLSPRTVPVRSKPAVKLRDSALNLGDIEAKVAGIEDPALQAALIGLGKAMGAR